MKNFLEWLKPGIRVKRYILLQLLSICVLAYAVAKLFMQQVLEPKYMLAYVALIVISAFTAIFSFMLAQRGVLAMTLKHMATDEKNLDIKKLITTDAMLRKGPKIVLIGGGKGLANIIAGLKESTSNITAIIATFDGTGVVQDNTTDMLPPGDIRRDLIALAKDQPSMEKLLKYRFKEEYGLNVTLGSMIVEALTKTNGSFPIAVTKLGDLFRMKGNLLPVSCDQALLCAGMENGEIIVGGSNIKKNIMECKSRVKQIFVKDCRLNPAQGVLEAIRNADLIVVGPGSLYTSVIANFLVEDVAKEITLSSAKKVMISNLMNEPGETNNYTLAKHINEVERYIGGHVFDYLIANNGEITEEMICDFNQGASTPILLDLENIQNRTVSVIQEDLVVTAPNSILHDNVRVADMLIEIAKSKKTANLNLLKQKNKHKKKEKNFFKKAKVAKQPTEKKSFAQKMKAIKFPSIKNNSKEK